MRDFLHPLIDRLMCEFVVVDRELSITQYSTPFYATTAPEQTARADCRQHYFEVSLGRNTPCELCECECPVRKILETNERAMVIHYHEPRLEGKGRSGLMLDTGTRAGEVAGASLKGLNLVDGTITILVKGSKVRMVPIGKSTHAAFIQYVNYIRPKTVGAGSNNLFLAENGNPITVNTIKLMFSRLAKKSGVSRLHAHLCRHTFAINYLMNGGGVFSLKAILGHETLEMVNRYVHFNTAQIAVPAPGILTDGSVAR